MPLPKAGGLCLGLKARLSGTLRHIGIVFSLFWLWRWMLVLFLITWRFGVRIMIGIVA